MRSRIDLHVQWVERRRRTVAIPLRSAPDQGDRPSAHGGVRPPPAVPGASGGLLRIWVDVQITTTRGGPHAHPTSPLPAAAG